MPRLRLFLVFCVLTGVGSASSTAAQTIREVSYHDRGLITVTARLRYTSVIVLPETDVIQEALCGDPDFWIINVRQNRASIKPAKAGASTNLHLVSPSGRIYTFLLQETSTDPPDVKVFVTDTTSLAVADGAAAFAPVAQLAELRTQLDDAQHALVAAQTQATQTIEAFRTDYPTQLRFDYAYRPSQQPFFVRAMWHDGKFTFIRADARELPALYEERDGQPNLLTYQVREGTYVIPRILDQGYLRLGKKRWSFRLITK